MNKPTFIEVPLEDAGGKTIWINVGEIESFGETYDGHTGIVMTSDGSTLKLDISIYELMRILRVVGCRVLTIDDIDNIEYGRGDISE